MIITSMQYLEPVYRGRWRGTNFEYVHLIAQEVKPHEREGIERIAKKWTHIFGIIGLASHSEDNRHARYQGFRNKVRFVQRGDVLSAYIRGPLATEIGQDIEHLPFLEFFPSKETVVSYDLESRVVDKNVLL